MRPTDDPVAVQADGAVLDALPGVDAGCVTGLTRLLVLWRRDVHADPVGELVDTGTALARIRAARTPRTRIGRALRRAVAALRGTLTETEEETR